MGLGRTGGGKAAGPSRRAFLQQGDIPLGPGEDAGLRAAVDRELAAMLLEDSLGLDLEVVTVEGSRQERVAQVLRRIP